MKPVVLLTPHHIASLKPRAKEYALDDPQCPGLRLRILPGGTKSWVIVKRIDGKPRRIIPDWLDAAFGLGLLVIILLNGLRQKPSLAPDVATTDAMVTKYEKSALTSDMAIRIERKLRMAMTEDQLHRDPNLSLWSLARHIGASPNYISQTLNENIGESFFDFVNGYRIADAQSLLRDTDDTVLTITYDAGFNSRSSFYTAFKKVTGQTPTAYRQAMSAPA